MLIKTRIIIFIILPIVIFVIAYFRKNKQATIRFLLFLFWIPTGLSKYQLSIFEICIYVISFLILIKFPHSGNEQLSYECRIKCCFTDFPWRLFLLYILGALITWLFSTKITQELSMIRNQCIFPLALSLVIYVSVRSSEDAERSLWALLTSAAILSLLFLVGQYFTDYIRPSSYAPDSGRLSMELILPHRLGRLEMLPQRTSCFYSYLLMYAYSLWIFHPSAYRRLYAFCLCLIYACIIITSQGRGAALAAAIGGIIISFYAVFKNRKYELKGIWIKCVILTMAVIGGLWYLATNSTNEDFRQHGLALFNRPGEDENFQGRLQRISDAIELYKNNPILGTGLRGYDTPWGLDTSEVLNVFLYTLLSFGLLGFMAFLLILRRFIIACVRGIQSENRTLRMMCIAGICGLMGHIFGLQALEPYGIAILWTPLVLIYAVSKSYGNVVDLNRNSMMS
jgi:O-antigen ligase